MYVSQLCVYVPELIFSVEFLSLVWVTQQTQEVFRLASTISILDEIKSFCAKVM